MEYTEKRHAARLIKMLESQDVCNSCPASVGLDPNRSYLKGAKRTGCEICTSFVGLRTVKTKGKGKRCPCLRLRNPIKTTWLALEAKGYTEVPE